MRQRNRTVSLEAKRRPSRSHTDRNGTSTRLVEAKAFPRRKPLVAALSLALYGSHAFAAGNNIVVDGRTQTNVQVNGATTNINTSTLKGGNAFNSFSNFSVGQGNTVNLQVPSAAANLVNLVHDSRSVINGVLNAYKNGQIGGNVFFANPYGFVVGATGVVNVGSLSVSTPSRAFLDQLIGVGGAIDTQLVQQLLSGNAPLSPSGVISIQGKVNALDSVSLRGWDVSTGGVINAGPAAVVQVAMFNGTVNAEGMQQGTQMVARNGVIEIVAGNDANIGGKLVADGASGVNGGRVNVEAGRNIAIAGDASISAKGVGANSSGGNVRFYAYGDTTVAAGARVSANGGSSGDGGAIEVSAAHSVIFSGGSFDTSAPGGKAGLLFVDPTDIAYAAGSSIDQIGDFDMSATNSITVAAGGHIRTVNGAGDSGSVTLTAPNLDISGTIDTSNAGSHKAGDVTLNAKAPDGSFPSTTVNLSVSGTIDATAPNGTAGNVTLAANAESAGTIGIFSAASTVAVAGTIKGGDVLITSNAYANVSFDSTPASIPTIALTSLLGSGIGIDAMVVEAHADSSVNIAGTINSTGDVTISSRIAPKATTPAIVFDLFNPISIATVYGEVLGTATATIGSTAHVTTGSTGSTGVTGTHGKLSLTAASDVTLDARAFAFSTDTGQYFAGTGAFGKADITTTAAIAGGADIKTGAVDVIADNQNSFSVTASSAANKQGIAGLAIAVSDLTTNTSASLGASLGVSTDGTPPKLSGNVTVQADSVTTNNTTGTSTDVGTSLANKLLLGAADKILDVAKSLLGKSDDNAKGGSGSASGTTPWKVGSSLSINNTTQNVTAKIAGATASSAPVIQADGDVVVHSNLVDSGVHSYAGSYINSSIKDEDKPDDPAAKKAASFALAFGNFDHDSAAIIGDSVQITAARIGIGAESDLPVSITWDQWAGFSSILNKFSARLGLEKEVLTSYANAQGAAIDGGYFGSVNIFQVDNDANASIGVNATLTATQASDAAWQTQLHTALSGATGYTVSWSNALTVDSRTTLASVNMAGDFSPYGFGTKAGDGATAVGLSFNYINYDNTTNAGIGAGAVVNAAGVGVNALAGDQALSIAPTSGSGDGKSINGIIAFADFDNHTQASISNLAKVEAGNVALNAQQEIELWTATGALATSGSIGIGISVAANDVSTDTEAFIGDNSGWIKPGSLTVTAPGYVHADTVAVNAGSDGEINALAVSAADVSSADSQQPQNKPSKLDQVQTKLTGLQQKFSDFLGGANTAIGKATAPATPSGAGTQGGPQPKYGLSLSGSATVNIADMGTRAYINGATISPHTLTVPNDVTVRAVNMTDIISASGGAALTRAKSPSTEKTDALAGAVAYSSIGNTVDAHIANSTLTDVDDVTVQALNGGFEVTVALALAVNKSTQGQKVRDGAGSVSIAQVDNDTISYVSDSSITGMTGKTGQDVEVTAYSQALVATGGGAFYGGGKQSVGIAVSYSSIDNDTDAYVEGSGITKVNSLTVQGLEANTIVGGAAMGGITGQASSESYVGGFVFNEIDQSTSAEIRADDASVRSTIGTAGNVNVLAKSTRAVTAYDSMLNAAVPSSATRDSGISIGVSYGDTDMPFGTGNLIIGAAGMLQIGKGENYGVGVVIDKISNDHTAVIENAGVTSTLGTVNVTAKDESTIIGIAAGISVSTGAGATSGMGTGSINLIDNTTVARIGVADPAAPNPLPACVSPVATCSTTVSAGSVQVNANNEADIWALAGTVAFASSKSAGAAISYNETTNTSAALINAAKVDAGTLGAITVNGTSSSKIESASVAIAAGGQVALSGALDWNVIGDSVNADVTRSAVKAGSLSVSGDQGEGIDKAAIYSLSGAGLGININDISNDIGAHITDSALSVTNAVNVSAISAADIWAGAGSLVVGGNESVAIGIASAANTITNTVVAGITNSSLDQSANVTTISASDDSNIRSGVVALAFGGNAGSIAIAYNDIDNNVHAFVHGNADANATQVDYNAKNVIIRAASDADIQTLAAGVAVGSNAGAGSTAINLMGTDVTADIGANAHVKAENNVGVLAKNDDSIAVIAGAIAIGGGAAGVGLSVVVNHDNGDTAAYVNGAGTLVDAKGKNATDTLSVDSGVLVDPIDVSGIVAPSVSTPDMSETQTHVSGLAVVATSHQAAVTNAVTLGISGGSTGIALVPVVNLMGGSTRAYIEDAAIDTRLGVDPTAAGFHAPDVDVTASSHTYTQNLAVAIAGGPDFGGAGAASANQLERTTDAHITNATIGAAYEKDETQVQTQIVQPGSGTPPQDGTNATAGSPTDGSNPSTTTLTTTHKSLLPVVGAVSVNALASQGAADIVIGGAAGAGAGVGTVVVDLFNAHTSASLDGGALHASSLSVIADSKSGFNALTASGGFGAGGAVAGAFVVGVAGDTTSATIGNRNSDTNLSLAGALNVKANTEDEFNSLVISGSIGGAFGIAAMADVTSVQNSTTAGVYRVKATKAANPTTTTTTDANGNVTTIVDGTADGRFATGLGDVTVSATEKVTIAPEAGAGGVGLVGGGVGAGANVVLVKSNVTSEVFASQIDSTGTVAVNATSDKSIDAVTVTFGAGLSGGLGAGVAVIKIGDGDISAAMDELNSGGTGTLSQMDQINSANKPASGNSQLSQSEQDQLGAAGTYSVADAINDASSDSITASIAGGNIHASTVNVNAQGAVSTSSVVGAVGIGGTLGAGGAVGYTRVYDTVTASATQTSITASTLNVTANLADGSAGSAVSVEAYAGGAGLVGLGAAVADTQISNTVTAAAGGSFTGDSTREAKVSATDSTSISAKGIGAAVGAAAAGVVIVDAHKRSTVDASVLSNSSVGGYALSINALNQGDVDAYALGAAGGLLAAGSGAEANASNISTVRAHTGDHVALPEGNISIIASNSSNQSAEADGVAIGGIIAASGAVASAWSGTSATRMVTEATLGDANTVSSTRAGTLTVNAFGVDTNTALAQSASGGVLAGNASIANTSDWSTVTAQAGGGTSTNLFASTADIYAEHVDNYSMTGNSLSASVVGGSGAEAHHHGDSTVSSVIAANVHLTTSGDIDIGARNYFASVNTGPSGLAAGGGGLNGFGVGSTTQLDGTVNVTLGGHVNLTAGLDPFTAPADINLVAASVLHHSDEVTLTTGGVIQGAGVDSTMHATLANNVTIGASDILDSQGGINAGTFTQAYATATALVSTWGLAAIGTASALADVDTNQSVTVGTGAKLTAFDNINLTAGQDGPGIFGTIMIGGASAQGYVRGLIAVPYAYAETKMHNNTSLDIGAGAVVQSGQNVTLGGYRGTLTAAADGTGHGYELGFIPVTIGLDKGETASTSNVTINGSVTAGMYHDLTVDIALNPAPGAFTPGITIHDGGYRFSHSYDSAFTLDDFVAGMDPSDAAILRAGTSSSPVGAQVFGAMFASGGVVNIHGDNSIGGAGSVTAYGAPKITVNNASRDYLVLEGALIPNQPGGSINFTGNTGTAGGVGLHEIGEGVAGSITVNNTYNTVANGNVGNSSFGPAMLLTGPITNLGGLINLTSASGSLGQTGQVFGQTVQIDFPAGVAVISVPGTYTAGGNPISDWGPYMIFPGGNPASGAPSADLAIAYVANSEHYADRFNADGTLRTNWQFTQALIGVEGTMPGQGPHGNESYVYYGNCATAGAGDCSPGTAAALSPTHETFSQHSDWYYAVIPVLDLTKNITAYPQTVLDNAARSSSIYGAQVSINARYIDVNATISAGQPTNWSVNLPANLTNQIAYDNFLYSIGAGTIFNVVGTANGADALIGVKYNAQTQQLIVDDVNASSGGGSVKLTGGILSTNPLGKIHVNGGLGQVTIDNQTKVPLVVQNVNAGDMSLASALSSQVEIVDTLQKIAGGTNPDHWWYVYNPSQGVSVYNNANGAKTLKDSSGNIIASQVTTNGPLQYRPRQDLRWQWEEVATMQRQVPWHYANGQWVDDGVSHWQWTSGTANNPWLFKTSGGALSKDPQGDNVFIKPNDPNVFEQSVSGSSSTGFTWNIYHVGCDGYIGSSCHYNFAQTTSNPDESHWLYHYQTSARLTLTQSVKADNPFGIDFAGNAVGKIAVSSNAPVSLNGTLVNPNGNTSLTATQAATPLSNDFPILVVDPRQWFPIPILTSPRWNQALTADAAGSSITETATGGIRTGSLTISAAAGIGSVDSAFRATLAPGGVLQADGGNAGVYLNLNSGANIKSVSSGNATNGYGDVRIVAAGDLMPTGGGTNVSARSIDISTTQGSIGSSVTPLVISAHQQQVGNATGGIVNVTAPGNIGLRQVGGDLLVGAITSNGGYIDVAVPNGSILDASGLTSGQALSPEQVQKVWQDLHLTSAYGAEANAIATSVKPLEDRVNLHYGQYLTLLDHGTVSNGAFTLGGNAADTALFAAAAAAAGQTSQAYAAALYQSLTDSFAADIGANWSSVARIAAKDPTFKYTASAAQVDALTGNAVWSENQLTIAIRKAALDPDPGPRPVGTGVPNIVALSSGANGVGNVKLSAGGSIGNLATPAVITANDLATGVLTATQVRALALAASPGDVTLTWEDAQHHVVTLDNSGANPVWKDYLGNLLAVDPVTQLPSGVQLTNVQIRQTAPLFVNAPGALDVTAGQGVYLQSSQQVKLNHLQASGPVNLATTLGISAATPSSAAPQIVTPGDLSLNAEQDDIGTDADHPLSIQVGGKLLVATAGKNVWLSDPSGDLVVGNIFAGNALAIETLGGSILADPSLSGLNLRAHDIDLKSSSNIGSSAKSLRLATALDGELNGTARGSAWIDAPASSTSNTPGSLTIGQFSAGGDLTITTAQDLAAQDLESTGASVNVFAGRDATLGSVAAVGDATLAAVRTLTLTTVTAGGDISMFGGGALNLAAGSSVSSGAAVDASGGTFTMASGSSIVAADAVTITTTAGNMVLGGVQSSLAAGDAFILNSAGTIAGNGDGQVNLVTTEEAAHTILQAQSGIGAAVLSLEVDLPWLQAGTSNGDIHIHNRHASLHLEPLAVANGSVDLATDGALDFSTVAASGDVGLSASGGTLTGTGIAAGGNISATAAGALVVQSVQSGGSSTLDAGTGMTFDSITAGARIALTSAEEMRGTEISAGGNVAANAGDALTVQTVHSGGSTTLGAGADMAFTSVSAGTNVVLTAAGAMTGTQINAGGAASASAGGTLALQTVSSVTSTMLNSGADLSFDTVNAGTGVSIAATNGLSGNSITSGASVTARAGDALDIHFITSADSTSLASGGDMTLDTITAGGEVALDFGGALRMKNFSATSASVSGAHAIVIDHAQVLYGLNLAAPDIDVGVDQMSGLPPLNMNVTGYRGAVANTVMLDINAPAGVVFGKLWGGQVDISTTGDDVRIGSGNIPGALTLNTPVTSVLMDNQNKTPRVVNMQFYEPDFQFRFLLTGRSAFTDAYVLRFDEGYSVGVPNYTASHAYAPLDVFGLDVVNEATRNSQFRPPFNPFFTPPFGTHGPWTLPRTRPVAPPPEGGAVNVSGAEANVIEVGNSGESMLKLARQ